MVPLYISLGDVLAQVLLDIWLGNVLAPAPTSQPSVLLLQVCWRTGGPGLRANRRRAEGLGELSLVDCRGTGGKPRRGLCYHGGCQGYQVAGVGEGVGGESRSRPSRRSRSMIEWYIGGKLSYYRIWGLSKLFN